MQAIQHCIFLSSEEAKSMEYVEQWQCLVLVDNDMQSILSNSAYLTEHLKYS